MFRHGLTGTYDTRIFNATMIFSLFKKPSKTPAPESAATSAAQGEDMQNPDSSADAEDLHNRSLGDSHFSDFSPGESLAGILVEEGHPNTDADAEEAAMLYANRQNDEARSVLEEVVQRRGHDAGEWLWRMLFDLYRVVGDHKAFDAMGIEYARVFEKSPPIWRGEISHQPASSALVGGVSFNGDLVGSNKPAFAVIRQALEKRKRLRIDFSRTRQADAAGCANLLALIQEARPKQKEIDLLGLDSLTASLQARLVPGEAKDQECWLLFLELCQRQGKQDVFENTAIDYAVTFELSPPSWDERCVSASKRRAETVLPEEAGKDAGQKTSINAYVLEGDVRGVRFDDLGEFAETRENVMIDCSGLLCMDFVSAGVLANILAGFKRQGKTVVLYHPNYLVAGLFRVLGLNASARIVLPKL